MSKWDRKESDEAFKRVKKGDWALVLIGVVLFFVTIIYSLILWDSWSLMLIVCGFFCLILVLLHLAWASSPICPTCGGRLRKKLRGETDG